MAALDLVLVVVGVVAAGGFLVWRIALKKDRAPACHPSQDASDDDVPGANVVVGGALARGLKAARDKDG